jgi:hypothetical protein
MYSSSEIKHDRRAVPRPHLFQRGAFSNKGRNPKNMLGSSSGEDCCFSSVAKTVELMRREYINKGHNHEKLS